jgi:hypothetical protein
MAELIGIIAPLRKLLSDEDEAINVRVKGANQSILELNKSRKYIIPDFQREIRWDKDNLSQLIDDIYTGPKYLGNIILTKDINKNEYLIIDGQQRMTVITMILCYLRSIHNDKIDLIKPCKLSIESFQGFETLIENSFSDLLKKDNKILFTDKLFQINKYYELWHHIKEINHISNRTEAIIFIDNLKKSTVNIILNESDDTKDGIRYFIDVNLKGKQLDTEDIFKGYLFRNDVSQEIRNSWYELKTNIASIQEKKIKYPILKIIEHFFYCDLYNDKKFKNLTFDEEFLLKSEFEIKDGSNTKFRRKTHLIEVINDKSYMINSINEMNRVIGIMIDIVDTNSPSDKFRKLFNCPNGGTPIDFDEMGIFHNFMRKILKDEKILPKALLMKYILSVLITKNNNIEKRAFKRIYGVYVLSVLFMIFQSKKNIDVFLNVLKASNNSWYEEALKVINSYFEASKITDNKIIAQFKKCLNEEEEDYRFRCKSLATIYNFFIIKNDQICISDLKKLKKFISDDEAFTTEHFVISESKHKQLIFSSSDEEKLTYKMEEKIYKQYVNNLFNFIFISREINDKLGNYWLPHKLKLINIKDIECEYSKMVIENIEKMSNDMESYVKKGNYKNDLDSFFYKDFKEKYIDYSRNVLNAVIKKIKNQ